MVEVSRFPESRIGYRIFLAHRHIGRVLNIEEAAEIRLALGSARNGLRLRLGGGGLGQPRHWHQSQRGPEERRDTAERKTVLHGPPVGLHSNGRRILTKPFDQYRAMVLPCDAT